MGWLRCRLSFAILRSAIMCIRGTRSSFGFAVNEGNLTLASVEGQVQPNSHQLCYDLIHLSIFVHVLALNLSSFIVYF